MVEQKAKAAAVKKTVATAKSKALAPATPAAKKTAAAPAVKKSAASAAKATPAAKKDAATPAKKTTTRRTVASKAKTSAAPSAEERYRMVETAAYFIAERHGFQGNSTEHWVEAERQIAVMLGE